MDEFIINILKDAELEFQFFNNKKTNKDRGQNEEKKYEIIVRKKIKLEFQATKNSNSYR